MENIEKCGTCRFYYICDHNKYGFENCGNYISADVVPRSEYEKAIGVIKEVHRLATEAKANLPFHNEMIKTETAREIFSELEKLHLHITNEFDARRYAKLKKKYTEGIMI